MKRVLTPYPVVSDCDIYLSLTAVERMPNLGSISKRMAKWFGDRQLVWIDDCKGKEFDGLPAPVKKLLRKQKLGFMGICREVT